MRPAAALLAGAAGWALAPANAAHALEAGDVAWGCEDAGFAQPVGRDGETAHRALVLLVHTDWGVLPAILELPAGQVYTGDAPACTDLDGDGTAEVVAAISGTEGAWLTVYGKRTGPIASTEPVAGGVSVVGGADLDRDGTVELAWIEDPGGAGRLRVGDLRNGAVVEIASADGFAHRRPDGMAAGAIGRCGKRATELILPRGDWSGLVRVRLADSRLVSEKISDETDEGAQLFAAFMECAKAQHEETQ